MTNPDWSFAKVNRHGITDEEFLPELFLVGKACLIMHKAAETECPSRTKSKGKQFCQKDRYATSFTKNKIEKSGDGEEPEWFEHRTFYSEATSSAAPIFGKYGAYPIDEGHYFCFNPYVLGGIEDLE